MAQKVKLEANFEQLVPAKLQVVPEYGEPWDATSEDLERFGYSNRLDLYMRAHDMLHEAMGVGDRDELPDLANTVRYMIECAIMYDHSPWANENGEPWPEDEESRIDYKQILRDGLSQE